MQALQPCSAQLAVLIVPPRKPVLLQQVCGYLRLLLFSLLAANTDNHSCVTVFAVTMLELVLAFPYLYPLNTLLGIISILC